MEPSWSVPSRPAPRRRPHRGERHRAGGAWTRARTFLEPSWSLLGASRQVDASLGLGVAFTAHPREDRKRGRVVGWSWAAPLVGSSLSVTVHEWDAASGALLASTPTALPSAIAPHDFALTDSWHADSAASRQESEGGRLSLSTPPPDEVGTSSRSTRCSSTSSRTCSASPARSARCEPPERVGRPVRSPRLLPDAS